MIRRRYGIISFIVVLALAGCQAASAQSAPRTATVERGSLVALVNAAGTVEATSQVNLAFGTSGRVTELDVAPGDKVKAGQTLAKLDTTDLELAVKQAQVSLDTANTQLAQTEAGPTPADLASAQTAVANAYAAYQAAQDKYKLTNAQITVARAQLDSAAAALARVQAEYDWQAHNWLNKNLVNSPLQTQLNDAQSAYGVAQAQYNQAATSINDTALKAAAAQLAQAQYQLDSLRQSPTPQNLAIAKAQVQQAEAGLAQAQANLAQAIITAPFGGTVADVNISVGQVVDPSVQALVLADLSQLDVAMTVADVDEPKVQVGQPVQVTLDAVPNVTFAGRVTELDLAGTTTQGVVNYGATAVITNPTAAVRPGMSANVSIIVAQRENVLLVPNAAVRTIGTRHLVTVLYKGQDIETPVTLGLSGDTQTEVLSGLKEGDVVIMGGSTTTTPGGGRGGFPGFGG